MGQGDCGYVTGVGFGVGYPCVGSFGFQCGDSLGAECSSLRVSEDGGLEGGG